MTFKIAGMLMAAGMLSVALGLSSSSEMRIEFTSVPRAGQGAESRGNIAGRVVGLEAPEKYKIVLYTHTDKWYVQPLEDDSLTDIHSDGAWSNWTHLGDRYAALVVNSSYKPAPRGQSLPKVDHKDVLARNDVAASAQ